MFEYHKLLNNVLSHGDQKSSRAGPVQSLPHQVLTHDMRGGFPAITGRKLQFAAVAAELECFVKGKSLIGDFHERNCHIWDANLEDFNKRTGKSRNTDLGPIYGRVWRGAWLGEPDQLAEVLTEARQNPQSRRLLVTAWVPGESTDTSLLALPPCHVMWQISICGPFIDMCFYMRSVDLALGLPFDIASYGLLQSLIANELMYVPRYLTAFMADAHVYESNRAGVLEYLDRAKHPAPTLQLDMDPGAAVVDFKYTQARLLNYSHGAPIKMVMAV